MAPWVNQICAFLHTIQGQIQLSNPWHPPAHCEHDHFIMEDVLNMQAPKWQALQIQNVHLFLQVTMISNIVDHPSTHVIPAMLNPVPAAQYDQHY